MIIIKHKCFIGKKETRFIEHGIRIGFAATKIFVGDYR